jgi:uncharacterized protein YdiU (UPF0061 family)
MLVYRKNCKTCKAVRANPKLLKRIYGCSYFIPHAKDSLRQIYEDCKAEDPDSFSYIALLNHVKKHQHLNAEDYNTKMLQQKAKQAVDKITADRYNAQEAQDAVINAAMEKLEKGELKLTTGHLLRAAKDKQDALAKVRDQQIQVAEMIAFYASGEDKYESERIYDRRHIALEEYDPALPITDNPDSRQE